RVYPVAHPWMTRVLRLVPTPTPTNAVPCTEDATTRPWMTRARAGSVAIRPSNARAESRERRFTSMDDIDSSMDARTPSASRLSRSVSSVRLFVDAIHFIHGRAIVSPEATDLVAES